MVLVRDITTIAGVRDNPLVGYSLVVGLNGTGDRRQTLFTTQTLANIMQRMGVQIPANQIRVNNIAAVFVTASLPPFARQGMRSTLRFPQSATPRVSKAGCCSWLRCTVRMARSMRRPKDRLPWVDIQRGAAEILSRSIIPLLDEYPTVERSNVIPRLILIVWLRFLWCCATPTSPPRAKSQT